MKQNLKYLLSALIIVTFIFMVASFFFTFPQPLVIADTAVLIASIAGFLFLDKEPKNQKQNNDESQDEDKENKDQ